VLHACVCCCRPLRGNASIEPRGRHSPESEWRAWSGRPERRFTRLSTRESPPRTGRAPLCRACTRVMRTVAPSAFHACTGPDAARERDAVSHDRPPVSRRPAKGDALSEGRGAFRRCAPGTIARIAPRFRPGGPFPHAAPESPEGAPTPCGRKCLRLFDHPAVPGVTSQAPGVARASCTKGGLLLPLPYCPTRPALCYRPLLALLLYLAVKKVTSLEPRFQVTSGQHRSSPACTALSIVL